jgi:hypothetical protein
MVGLGQSRQVYKPVPTHDHKGGLLPDWEVAKLPV